MSIKIKLYLAFGFLFGVILLLGGMGSYYLRQLAKDSQLIIKDNYETLIYTKGMQKTLSALKDLHGQEIFNAALQADTNAYGELLQQFEGFLTGEEANITEIGEGELVADLRQNYLKYISLLHKQKTAGHENKVFYFSSLLPTLQLLERQIAEVTDMNMQAIVRKNGTAQQTARRVLTYMAIIGTAAMLTAFAFLVIFPGYVANPIRELTSSIEEIANRNYDKRLDFDSYDEYGSLATAFNTMASRLNEYEHSNVSRLLFEKKRIETIINHMQDAIIGLDENKYILFANPQALKMLGMEESALAGKYAPDIASVNDLMRSLIQELMIGFDAWEKQEFRPLKIYDNGKESYFSKEILDVSTSKTNNGKVKLIGHVIILKNITKFQELDAAKTNFIATISHELKTPISSIKMSAKLLEDNRIGAVNHEQKKLIANIKEDTRRLLRITGELLDLAQVETGNIGLHLREADPVEIVEYACQAVEFVAAQKQVILEKSVPASIPTVQADIEKTVWVMINLLSNAIRYSPEGGKIIVSVIQQNGQVAFSVQDFGKGIEDKYRERIFDKFFQVPENNGSKTGTGLGLAISKEFIGAQGGSIWVESVVDAGSTFGFLLPIYTGQANLH
jgi:PAS domain S-box-containing protein